MLPERPSRPSGPGQPPQATASTAERWAEIQRIVDGALDLPAAEREAHLRAACSDPGLREEAARLLEACDRASGEAGLFQAPAAAFAAPLLAEAGSAAAARAEERRARLADTLRRGLAGRYQLERELGRGGMATVYLARDLRHERAVAIKVMEGSLARGGAERFLREIRVTARLTHPHVLGVHDSGECDGLLYYVMPYVEGETLRARLAREGALPLAEGVRLLRELADALAYAHSRGVIHRDLKPENVLLSGAHAVVADFGIARALAAQSDDAAQATLTATGVSLGTPAYMAPEQVLGEGAPDPRVDLYALGVVAYEVLTGAHPFAGRSRRELLAAHLTETPTALQKQRADVPPALAALVARLLAKDPADRPQSAEAVLHALEDPHAPAPRRPRRARLVALAAGALLLASAGYEAYRGVVRGAVASLQAAGVGDVAGTSGVRALAVLPFENTSGNRADDYFSDGMSDELAYALAHLPGLRLAGRTSTYAFRGKAVPAQEIGHALGVGAIVSGTVRRAGERLRVTAQLVSTADGKVVWDSVFESRSSDVFAVQDDFTHAIVQALAPALRGGSPGAATADRRRGTGSEEAYDLYLKGHYYFMERGAANVTRAIGYFRQAIAVDPRFARAHAGLAMAYAVLPVYVPDPRDTVPGLVMASALRAMALDSTVADAHLALAYALDLRLRLREALAQYRAGVALEPSSVTGRHWLGIALLNLGRTEEGLVELRHATQLDPLATIPACALAFGLLSARRFAEATVAAQHALALDSTLYLASYSLSLIQTFSGQLDGAVITARRGLRLHPEQPDLYFALALADAAAGQWAEAARVRQRMRRPGADPIDAARLEYIFGNHQPLVRLFSTQAGQRLAIEGGGIFGCNPLIDPLWSDARFRASMNALGVETCRLARPWPVPAPPGR